MTVSLSNIFRPMQIPATEMDHHFVSGENTATPGQDPDVPERTLRPLSPFQPGRINPFVQREASTATSRSDVKSLPAVPSREDALPRPLSPFQPGRINPFVQREASAAASRSDVKPLPAAPSRADALPRPLSPFQPGRINPFQQNDYANANERQDSFASVFDEPGFLGESAPAYTEFDAQPYTDDPLPPYSE